MAGKRHLDNFYDNASEVLDFIPLVGAGNRFLRGEYGDAALNLALDFTGPLKYIAKGAKGVKLLGKALKGYKKLGAAKKYEKALDKLGEHSMYMYNTGRRYDHHNKLMDSVAKRMYEANDISNVYKRLFLTPAALKAGEKVIGNPLRTILYDNARFNLLKGNISDFNLRLRIPNPRDYEDLDSYKDAFADAILKPDGSDPGRTIFLNRRNQRKHLESIGYHKVDDAYNYEGIEKAVEALRRYRLGHLPPVYQIGEDAVPRDSLIRISEKDSPISLEDVYSNNERVLRHAGSYPTIFYRHKNPNHKPQYYIRDIDLNDYGQHGAFAKIKDNPATTYHLQTLANLIDFFGNPFVQRSGIRPIYRNGGTIHINPANRGKFNALKARTGKTTEELTHSKNPLTRKRAIFAQNARKWNKK